MILLWLLDPTLLGTHNPELVGPENKALRIVLGRDPLHGLRLAEIEAKKISGQAQFGEWVGLHIVVPSYSEQDVRIELGASEQKVEETDLAFPQSEWHPPWSGNSCVMPGYNPRCKQPVGDIQGKVRISKTHELAHPISWFSHRPPPCKISKSILHPSPLAPPLCMVFRVGT